MEKKRGRPPKNKHETELLQLVQDNVDQAKEQQELELVEIEKVEAMTMTEALTAKQELAARRQEVMLKLDERRLTQAVKIMDAMDIALDKMIGQCTYTEDGDTVEMTAMDFKFYTDAYKNLAGILDKVSRLDSVDTGGKSTRISLKIEYE